jgi:hypothetical protein
MLRHAARQQQEEMAGETHEDPTARMGWAQMLGGWYRGEMLDRAEAQALWLRTLLALGGLWLLRCLAPS